MFNSLREAIGDDELLKLIQTVINSDSPERPHVPLHDAIIDSITHDPAMLDLILSTTALLQEKPQIALALMEKAYEHASSVVLRRQVKGMALRFRLACKFKKKPMVNLKQFTASQARAFQRLRQMAELYFSGASHHGVKLRVNPLLVGPSGVGKTHVVNALAEALDLPLLRLTVSDWLVTGCKSEPTTLQTLQDFIAENRRGVVFIDELDKVIAHDNSWSQNVLTELFSIIDRQVNYQGAKGSPWTADHTARLKKRIFLIGAGTWHRVWSLSNAPALGFGGGEAGSFDEEGFRKKVRRASVIPDELLNRFNDDWLMLEPYRVADYEAIVRNLGIDPMTIDPIEGAASGLNFRYVERALTNAALKRIATPDVAQG